MKTVVQELLPRQLFLCDAVTFVVIKQVERNVDVRYN